jgi:signal transduction histidine kinase/CheY-like chemotaxis protein
MDANNPMKKIRKINSDVEEEIDMKPSPWKVLIVDDEPDVHAITRLNLKYFEFAGRQLQFFEATTALEAKHILHGEPDIAVVLIDVVMETDDAGLRLVDYIRNELHNSMIRLIIRTGQPGAAPERYVIDHYDIDDYKDKTELATQKLYTSMRSTLKSYRDLGIIDTNRKALKKILDATPGLYQLQSINRFFDNVLQQIISLCNLGENKKVCLVNSGLVVAMINQRLSIQAAAGRFSKLQNDPEIQHIIKICNDRLAGRNNLHEVPADTLLIPLEVHGNPAGFVYLEDVHYFNKADQDLIQIMANQCASALENLQLYIDLKEANRQSLNMLAVAEQSRNMAETANRAKTTFLGNMSHELRTPLNAILGYRDVIYEEAEELGCTQILQYLDDIKIAGNKLVNIISDILDISQIETGKATLKPSEFKVSSLVEELVSVVQSIIKSEGNQFIVECPTNLGVMYADYRKTKQIVMNLLSNAVKFTTHGKIHFVISRETYPNHEDWLHFKVSDTGIGIEPEQLDKIFEAFTQVDSSSTRQFGGTGLGLAISKHFCQMMGGNISVETKLKEGSTFIVHLPAHVKTTT